MAILSGLRETLDAIDGRLWPLTIALAVWALYELFRWLAPELFSRLNPRLKAVPGLLIAAALSGLSGPDFGSFFTDTLIGVLVAGGGHEFIQRAKNGSKQTRVVQGLTQQKKSYP